MRTKLVAICGGATLTLVLALPAELVCGEDLKIPQSAEEAAKVMADIGKPGPEHAKLQPLAGSWTYTCKFWMDPSKPPLELTGTAELKWVLGGRFLEEKLAGTGFDGKPGFEGLGLFGYDNGQKKFTSTFACSMGTGTCAGVGDADSSGASLTFQTEAFCPLRKKTVKGLDKIRIASDDKIVTESYQLEDGKETKLMELVLIRKK
jgi:hypothetical protein